jgi:TP901 family phage tail tape measure protein
MTERVTEVSLVAQVLEFNARMRSAAGATEQVTRAAAAARVKLEEQNQAMNRVGATFTATGALAAAATALVVKAAIDWETAWAGVTKTVSGTPAQLQEIEDGLRSMARELPATHTELAGIAEAAGQLGVQRSGLLAFTRTMVDLSETTNLSADEASTSIAQLMNIMQTAPDDVDNLGASLVALGNNGASTERDIVQMAQRIAGAGKVVGLSEADVLAFANALASVGIDAEAGGSSISRVMTDIAMAVSDGGDELQKFADVAGVSAEDFATKFKSAPAEAIVSFIEGLGGINAAGGDVFKTLSDLGQTDIRVSQALLGMANSGDLLRNSLALGSKAWDENTALAAEAAKRYDTTASKLQVMSNRVTDAAIAFGDQFLPAVQRGADAVGAIADAFGDLPPIAQAVIGGLVGVTAIIGVGGGAFLLAVPKIAEYRVALQVLSTSTMPGVATAVYTMQSATAKAATGIAATARFLTGPWGIALVAAAVGVKILSDQLETLRATSNEVKNSLTTTSDGTKILDTVMRGQGVPGVTDLGESLENLDDVLHRSSDAQKNFFAGFSLTLNDRAVIGGIEELGRGLGSLADEDLPKAQAAFRAVAAQTDGSDESLRALLDNMSPYKDALYGVAEAQGINIANLDEAARYTELLKLAQGTGAPVTESAADAYKSAADEAAALADEVDKLLDKINEANGVGQDAVTSNARWQESLANISAEVQRQKDAFVQAQSDAYEAANGTLVGFEGTLDGFSLSLDEATAAGASNAAMLSDVAKSAQDAAEAQYTQDQTTMSAKDATDKYVKTLADSKQALIDQAVQNGFSADAVQLLADKVFALPSQREIDILADTSAAANAIDQFVAAINTRTATIQVNATNPNVDFGLGDGGLNYAGGGTVYGPGTAKSDSVRMNLSVGEEVTQEPYATQFRSVLKSINSGQGIPANAYQATRYVAPPPYFAGSSSSGPSKSYQFDVHPSPGMDEVAFARSLYAEAQFRERVSGP